MTEPLLPDMCPYCGCSEYEDHPPPWASPFGSERRMVPYISGHDEPSDPMNLRRFYRCGVWAQAGGWCTPPVGVSPRCESCCGREPTTSTPAARRIRWRSTSGGGRRCGPLASTRRRTAMTEGPSHYEDGVPMYDALNGVTSDLENRIL